MRAPRPGVRRRSRRPRLRREEHCGRCAQPSGRGAPRSRAHRRVPGHRRPSRASRRRAAAERVMGQEERSVEVEQRKSSAVKSRAAPASPYRGAPLRPRLDFEARAGRSAGRAGRNSISGRARVPICFDPPRAAAPDDDLLLRLGLVKTDAVACDLLSQARRPRPRSRAAEPRRGSAGGPSRVSARLGDLQFLATRSVTTGRQGSRAGLCWLGSSPTSCVAGDCDDAVAATALTGRRAWNSPSCEAVCI